MHNADLPDILAGSEGAQVNVALEEATTIAVEDANDEIQAATNVVDEDKEIHTPLQVDVHEPRCELNSLYAI